MHVAVGAILRHPRFYIDAEIGVLKPKFLLVLAAPAQTDVVFRLLTSRHPELRPEQPRCYHGAPYPGFYLGVPGGALDARTWVDLRGMDDYDRADFERDLDRRLLEPQAPLAGLILREALECAAAADDTTRQQEQLIRDALATLG